jgi:hypothetical protein
MSLGKATLDKVRRAGWFIEDFVCPDAEGLEDMGSERVDKRDIRRVAASRDHDPSYPRHIVARIERPPRPVEVDLNPGAEIHRIDNVAEMAIDVSSRNVEAATKRHRQMGEVPADSDPLVEGFKCCSGRSRVHIVELDVLMNEIAHGLHAPPAGRNFAE